MSTLNQLLLFMFCISNLNLVSSGCKNTYMPICETIRDVKHAKDRSKWEELLIIPNNDCRSNASLNFTLTKKVFTDLGVNNLKRLTIVRQLQRVVSFSFITETSLQTLSLFGNNMRNIRERMFENINLTALALKKNNFKTIKNHAFINCNIGVLDLSFNQIKNLPSNGFRETTVNSLRLNNNQLMKIQNYSLPSGLTFLVLNRNYLRSFSLHGQGNLTLKGLIISRNQLTHVELLPLPTLNYIDLGFNQLTTLGDELRNLTNLAHLNLRDNNLIKFDFDMIQQSVKNGRLLFLCLANNKLSELDLEKISNLDVYTILHGNPFSCQSLEEMNKFLYNSTFLVRHLPCDYEVFGKGQVPVCLPTDENSSISEARVLSFQKLYSKYLFCNVAVFYIYWSDDTMSRAPFDLNYRELKVDKLV